MFGEGPVAMGSLGLLKPRLSVSMSPSQGLLASVPAGLQPFTASLQWEITPGHCSCLRSIHKEAHDQGSCNVKPDLLLLPVRAHLTRNKALV